MRGFTLVEVLVVMSITVLLTGLMMTNFSRTRTDLNQTRLLVQDAIREAQALALAGSLYAGAGQSSTYRCGYGVYFEATGYTVYAGPDSATTDCSTENRDYESGTDSVVRKGLLSNSAIEIAPVGSDIFFEPPNPTTYINNDSSVGTAIDILIRKKGTTCTVSTPTADCRAIHVTTSGLITTQ